MPRASFGRALGALSPLPKPPCLDLQDTVTSAVGPCPAPPGFRIVTDHRTVSPEPVTSGKAGCGSSAARQAVSPGPSPCRPFREPAAPAGHAGAHDEGAREMDGPRANAPNTPWRQRPNPHLHPPKRWGSPELSLRETWTRGRRGAIYLHKTSKNNSSQGGR